MPTPIARITVLFALVLALVWSPVASAADDPPRVDPASEEAKPGVAYAWTSSVKSLEYDDDGRVTPIDERLRFTYVLPAGYDRTGSNDMVVICHGTGLDYRWGHLNFRPGAFRPHDVVVSVDGPTVARDDSRLFLGQRPDALAFRDFLLEASRTFRAKRIYLYGHSQGSFFVAYFAGEFPAMVDGVIAQSSGSWTWSRFGGGTRRVPIVFMHGTSDPVVPYAQSVGSRDAYRDGGHPMVHLRRLARYNHWPNAVRASECIDWCIGMRTESAAEALAAASSVLQPKGPDEYEYVCPVDYGGARQILRRFEAAPDAKADTGGAKRPPGPPPLKDLDDQTAAAAKALSDRIEQEGRRHVDALRTRIKSRADLTLAGPSADVAWIGHLVSVREDFRGVDSVEAYAREIELDAVLTEHAKAAAPMLEKWFAEEPAKDVFIAATEAMPNCFLHEGLPPLLLRKLGEWKGKAAELEIPADALERYEWVDRWREGWDGGLRAYAEIWKAWRVE